MANTPYLTFVDLPSETTPLDSTNLNSIQVDIKDDIDSVRTQIATDLTNYYTKTQIDAMISVIPKWTVEVVQQLPTQDISTTTIYLVPNSDPQSSNYYNEYIYVNNAWEKIGTTEVDLSNYYTKSEVDALLADIEVVPKYAVGVQDATFTASCLVEVDYPTEVELRGEILIKMPTLTLDPNYHTDLVLLNVNEETTNKNLVDQDGINVKTGKVSDKYIKVTYDGTNYVLTSTGGGGSSGDEVAISTTTPVDDEKIWINPNEAISGSLNPITNQYSIATDKGYSCEYLNGNVGKIIWESSASTMGGTTISLDLTSYKYIEIIFYTETATTNWKYLKSTGKLKVLASTTLTLGDYVAPNDSSQAPQFFGRNMTINNAKTSITVGSGFNVGGSTYTTRNSSGVPIEIIGYK